MDNAPQTSTPEQLLVHAQWVRRLALRMVSDPNVADDVVQETWMRAMERPPSGDVQSTSVRAWLARVVRSSVLQRFRGETRRSDREYLQVRDDSATSTSEQELVEQIDGQRLLVAELLELGEPMRSTVILRYFKDLSSAEIARRQGVPAATVRSRLSRAIEELRTRMDTRYDGNRSAWSLALAGSIGESFPLVPIAPPSSAPPVLTGNSIIEGVIAMKVGTGLAIALGIAAITVAGIAALDSENPASTIEAADHADEVAIPIESPSITAPTIAPEPERLAIEQEVEPAAKAETLEPLEFEAVGVVEPTEFEPSTCIARFTDAAGNPVAGVEWELREGWATEGTDLEPAKSGADGTVRISIPMFSETRSVALAHSLESYATGVSQLTARAGKEINVGSIELTYSVQIAGRVVDERGIPIAGAKVFVMPTDPGNRTEGELLRVGPGTSGELGELRHYLDNRSQADGGFELTAPTAQSVRVYAKAEGTRFGWTEPLQLYAGSPVSNQLIVLTRFRDDDHISGVVLDIDGNPIPGISIFYSFSDTNYVMSTSIRADLSGEFDLTIRRAVPHTFRVEGGDETPGIATAPSVEPGTLDLVLQLALRGGVLLYVEDEEGTPLESFELVTRSIFENGSSTSRSATHTTLDGTLSVPVPSKKFGFEVSRRGYVTQTLGPFDSGTYPAEIRCTLTRTPGIRGRIVIGERPLAGFDVRLLRAAPKGARYTVNGFPSRLDWGVHDQTTTDEEGAFLLSAPEDGSYIVHVDPPRGSGLAAVESEELQVFVAEAFEGVQLTPEKEGELVVVIRVAAGENLAGIIVGITDGGLDSRTIRTDESGTARFEGLRPGQWVVKQCEADLSPYSSSSSSSSADVGYEIPFNCEVRSGQVTEFELVL